MKTDAEKLEDYLKILALNGLGHTEEYEVQYGGQVQLARVGGSRKGLFIVPDFVTAISAEAFNDCEGIDYIRTSSYLKYIDDYAFCYCKQLKEIELHEGLEEIGKGCFYKCLALKKLIIPDSVRVFNYIEEAAKYLDILHVGKNVQYYDELDYWELEHLRELKLPKTYEGHILNIQKWHTIEFI